MEEDDILFLGDWLLMIGMCAFLAMYAARDHRAETRTKSNGVLCYLWILQIVILALRIGFKIF